MLSTEMQPEHKRPKIGHIFVEKGFITADQLEQALAAQSQSGKLLGEVLVELELIDRLDLASALGVQFMGPPRPRAAEAPAPLAPTAAPAVSADFEALQAELAALRAHNDDLRAMVAQLQADLAERDERLALLSYFVKLG
jgi:hypothetical protein